MSANPSSVEPPKPPPPDDGLPSGPIEPPKPPPPDDGLPPGPAEPEKPAPQDEPQVSAAANSTATLEPFDAPQAPFGGKVSRTDSPQGRAEGLPGQDGASEAPQAPGPEISLAP